MHRLVIPAGRCTLNSFRSWRLIWQASTFLIWQAWTLLMAVVFFLWIDLWAYVAHRFLHGPHGLWVSCRRGNHWAE